MRIEHIAMYVNDLEKAKNFFVHYFNAAANEGYHNKVTDFRSYFLSFDDGARLELMTKPQMTISEKALDHTGYIHGLSEHNARYEAPVHPQQRYCLYHGRKRAITGKGSALRR